MTNVIRQLCVDDSSSVHNSQRNQALAIRKPTADNSQLQKSPEALTQDRRIQRLERAMQLVETSNCLVCFCRTVEYRGINSKREIYGLMVDSYLFGYVDDYVNLSNLCFKITILPLKQIRNVLVNVGTTLLHVGGCID